MKHLYKYIVLLLTMVCAPMASYGQQSNASALTFSAECIDFGTIREVEGRTARSFHATNCGTEAISVTEIVTTCGCTTVSFNREPIPAGGSFSFDVIYDPLNRPGRFERNIMVTTSDAQEPIILKIIGRVEPRERSVYEIYPFDFGHGLRLQSNFHAFGYLEHGKEIVERIGYTNTSTNRLSIEIQHNSISGFLTIELPSTIEPGATGDIVLRYTSDASCSTYGIMNDIMHLIVNGSVSQYHISTQAIVVDNFDIVDDISAPRLDISKNIIKFGEVNCSNGRHSASLMLTNSGASPLYIRAMEYSSPAITATIMGATALAPGEQREVIVELNPALIEDVDNPLVARMSVITNDPMRPMQSVRITAIPY